MHIVVVTGASGAGKTTAVHALDARTVPGLQCFFFDSIGVPTLDEMRRDYGGGEQWQAWATEQWLRDLDRLDPAIRVAVLDGQTRPSYIAAAATALRRRVHTVLLDCDRTERERRLITSRRQPELATTDMAAWAAYLRGQADALGLPVLDTSRLTPDAVADRLMEIIGPLLAHEQPG